MKAEDHVADWLNDDQMMTIENHSTDKDIKKYETYVASMIDTNQSELKTQIRDSVSVSVWGRILGMDRR